MKKNKSHSNIDFRFMAAFFRIRDIFNHPIEKIRKANIKQGDIVLDYGCGSGSYTIVAAEEVSSLGNVIAADIHPFALKMVNKKAEKKSYSNITIVQTDCDTGIANESVDVVICFDVIHDIPHKYDILKEFHRVLKPNSTLSFDDHHLNENEIIEFITSEGLFKLSEKKGKQYNFIKV